MEGSNFAHTGPLAVLKHTGSLACSIRSKSPTVMSFNPIRSAAQPVSASHRMGPWFVPSSFDPQCRESNIVAAAQCAVKAAATRRVEAIAGAAGALPPPFGFRLRDLAFFFFFATGLTSSDGEEAARAGVSCLNGYCVPNLHVPNG